MHHDYARGDVHPMTEDPLVQDYGCASPTGKQITEFNNMENVKAIRDCEIASYSIRTDAGRLFFDLKWGDRENFLQITQSKKIDEEDFHREKIILSESELMQFRDGITKAMGFLNAIHGEIERPNGLESQNTNGYKPWENAEDERLLLLYQEGKSMNEIGALLGRSRGAIRSRFVKLMQEKEGELPMPNDE